MLKLLAALLLTGAMTMYTSEGDQYNDDGTPAAGKYLQNKWLDTPGATGLWSTIADQYQGSAGGLQGFLEGRPDAKVVPMGNGDYQITVGNILTSSPRADKANADAGIMNGSWIPMLAASVMGGGALGAFGDLAAGAGAAGGGGGAVGAGGMFSDLPAWAGGVSEGLGGGAAGAGLGGAAAPAIGTAAGAGLDAATGGAAGMFSDLPGWAGGVGGTSLGGDTSLIQQLTQQLQSSGMSPQQAASLAQQLTGGGGGTATTGGGAGGGGVNIGSLLPLLGIGSGLSMMFGGSNQAVDPAKIAALWQAGQNTYNTSLDPQNALRDRMQGQVVDATRGAQSARGIAMGAQGAGLESDAVSKFLQDWNNQQLNRQSQGVQSFAQAGNVGAFAGIANNAQAQTGLNNLTTGLGQVFGTGGTGSAQGAAGGNALGSWINSLFAPSTGATGTGGGSNFNPFPMAQEQAPGQYSTINPQYG